ncbi:MAG: molybdenum cofactor guanylyltransferase [Desulfarculus sp.]|nr:MAG: molybdenum cofactor guanylyltransferase [Desulfarculus sp.]
MEQGLWGVILAGGPGSRIGGHKPWRTLGGRRFIDLALAAARSVCPQCLVVTGQVEDFLDLDCQVLADRWPGQGPLAALATALLDSPAAEVLLLPVDAPLVQPALLELLLRLRPGHKAVAAQGPGGMEPLLAWYHRDCLPTALRLVKAGEKRPRMLLPAVKARILTREEVAAVDPQDLSFLNVNSPEDLAKAQEIAAQRGQMHTN